MVGVVAEQEDEVGLERHGEIDGSLDVVEWEKNAVVHVGENGNSEAVEGGGKARDDDGGRADAQVAGGRGRNPDGGGGASGGGGEGAFFRNSRRVIDRGFGQFTRRMEPSQSATNGEIRSKVAMSGSAT